MSFSAVLKAIVFVLILFVALYTGMNNLKEIDFIFPVAGATAKAPVHAPAALIYFGMFVVGVLAGTLLTAGGSKKKAKE